jgi:polysaccharide biosynthesis transport protein
MDRGQRMKRGNTAQASLHQGDEPLEPSAAELDPTPDFKRLQKGLNLRPLIRTIWRNALLVSGLAVTIAVANTLHSLRTPYSYSGGFRLLVEPITSEAKMTDPSVLSRGGEISSFTVDYPTLLQVLQSPGMLAKVAKRVQPRHPDVTRDSLLTDLSLKKLVIQRIGTNLLDNTKLIDVSYTGGEVEKVQAVLEAFSKEYLSYSLDARKSRISGGVEFIEGQLPELQRRVEVLQQKLQTLQQQYNLTDPNTQGAELVKQAQTIENQKLEAQRAIQEQQILYTGLQKQLDLSPSEAIAASVLSQDPRYQELLSQLKKVESEIAVKGVRFSEESPVLQALLDQQKNLKDLLGQETSRILGQSIPESGVNPQILTFQNSVRLDLIKQLAEAANQIQVLVVRNQAITQAEALTANQVGQFPAIIRQYTEIQRQLEIATKTLNQLTIQRDTLRVDAAQKEVPWQLVSEPKVPVDDKGNPIATDRGIKKKLPIGIVAGLLVGILSAVLLEKLRNVFFCTEDVQDAIKLPVLSVIPYSDRATLTPGGKLVGLLPEMTASMEPSLFQEAFSELFASLRFLESSRSIHSLVVGSAGPGEGKTTIALHLAQVAAATGQKVLLVDADFRTPQLHARLGLSNQTGLADILDKKLEPMDWVQPSAIADNLFVLTAGNLGADSPRQLATKHMQHLVEQFQAEFDLVIYDTPPLLGLSDTSFLTAYTDGLLLVVGIRKTKRSVVMQSLTSLQSFQLPVLGVVTNHVEKVGGASYGYRQTDYQPDQPLKPRSRLLPATAKKH